MMKNEVLIAKMELRELVDTFSNLADIKDAESQGELFLPDGVLEFQIGTDGEVQSGQVAQAKLAIAAEGYVPDDLKYSDYVQSGMSTTSADSRRLQ